MQCYVQYGAVATWSTWAKACIIHYIYRATSETAKFQCPMPIQEAFWESETMKRHMNISTSQRKLDNTNGYSKMDSALNCRDLSSTWTMPSSPSRLQQKSALWIHRLVAGDVGPAIKYQACGEKTAGKPRFLVDPSPWPVLLSTSQLSIVCNLICFRRM